ncbi:MAG: ATP-binding protein [Paludibacteraceae bacterium]|nr:ATP-binding protein [Paludibacteraceae bacterium]
MDKQILKQILRDNQQEIVRHKIEPREVRIDTFPCCVLVGVRRSGKSYMLYQRIQQLLKEGKQWDEILYLNFEDERLENFTAEDFNRLLECHQEMYGKRPMLFLDEIQNIDGWEKFSRRMADANYTIYITGSNAKMLSREINTTLGGRFLTYEVYPYSFKEYAQVHKVSLLPNDIISTDGKSAVVRYFNEYLHDGGLPASALLPVKRDYLSSVFQKIYLGDIVARNNITNVASIRLMLRKIAESVCRPISYNRINNLLSSVGGKLSLATTIKYIGYCEDAWLLMRLRNYASSLAEKESNCKYYFIDNGILNLMLIDKDTMLLENLVAIQLFRKYGHDMENERVFFYNENFEVDFYIPEDNLAIQVCYSLSDEETLQRELNALRKLPKRLDCNRRLIITFDEETSLTDEYGTIEVIPAWKWLICGNFLSKDVKIR